MNIELERKLKQMLETWATLYDRLESGESVEEINLDLDIVAAGRGWGKPFRKDLCDTLGMINKARNDGISRNELLTQLEAVHDKVRADHAND